MKDPVAKHAALPRHPSRAVAMPAPAGPPPHHALAAPGARPAAERAVWILILVTLLVVTVIAVTVGLSRRSMSPGVGAPVSHNGAAVSERSSTRPTPAPRRTSDNSATGRDTSAGRGPRQAGTIQLNQPVHSAKPYQAVAISGTHGGPDTLLQIQRKEQGRWVPFPVPTTTDQSGRFNTWVELGKPGRYWLRVLDPGSGATSEPFALVISG